MPQVRRAPVNPALAARSELISTEEAVAVAKAHYGITADAQKLAGEKDSNYLLRTAGNTEFLLKVVNPGEDPAVTNMHTLALLHVAECDPGMPVQRVVPNLAGEPEFRLSYGPGDVRTVRMVTFTQGLLQRKSPQTSTQRRNAGIMLGRLQEALQNFRHPAQDHYSTWDMKNAPALEAMLSDLPASHQRGELTDWLTAFEDRVLPLVPSLRAQVVHNDLNSDNIVVNPHNTDEIVGIIDFGDMVRTPVLFDVAVAAAYQLTDVDDPMAAVIDFVSGFHERRPLAASEVQLLFITIVARMVMRIAITEWRAVRFPENRQYIMRNTPRAWLQFHRLCEIPEHEATSQIASALSIQE